MKNNETAKLISQFAHQLQEMNHVYELYAKKYNLSYTTLQVINLITELDPCTQQKICEASFLPKQTVNSIITNLNKQEMLDLVIDPNNRRSKQIIFTNKGLEFTHSIIPQIREAELFAMEQLNEEQRQLMINSLDIYCQNLNKKMLK